MKIFFIRIFVLAFFFFLSPIFIYGQTEVITPQHKSIVNPNGRFLFGQISEMRRDQYMLDTRIGRLWQIVADSTGGISLSPILYQLLNGKLDITPEKTKSKSYKTVDGRFQFGQISKMRRDQYMLDTFSGRIWQIVKDKNELIILSPVPYWLLNGKYDIIPEK